MGVVADAALAAGGRVVGVIPNPLANKEIAHGGLTELHVVAGMHERKALMAACSAGFLALPGGIGTFEELFEIVTWAALGLHDKPISLLNVEGYFDPLLALLDHAVAERFVRPEHLATLVVSDQPGALAADLLGRTPPHPGAGGLTRDRLDDMEPGTGPRAPTAPTLTLGNGRLEPSPHFGSVRRPNFYPF